MKSVFFDSIGGTAARSSFPAKTPTQLINCYLVFAIVRGTAQFEGRRNRGASAADDGNFDRLLFGQIISSDNRISGARAAERNIQYAREYVNRGDARVALYRTVPPLIKGGHIFEQSTDQALFVELQQRVKMQIA